VVGHLLLEDCFRQNGLAHADAQRLNHFENHEWSFQSGDWFDGDPCGDWQNNMGWYAPDLIGMIAHSRVGHEIACHTFSHIDCTTAICPEIVLREEIEECRRAVSSYGTELTSFVFPGNLIGNTNVLKGEYFSSYRVESDVLGFPAKDAHGLWQVPTTAEICPTPYGWNPDYYVKRYKTIVNRAIKHKRLCHFWFHPSMDTGFLTEVLTPLFGFIDSKRRELCMMTMKDYIGFLEGGKN